MFMLITILLGFSKPVAAMPPPQAPLTSSDQQLIDQIKQLTQNKVRISYHTDTGKVNFIGADFTNPIAQPGLLPANVNPEVVARGFLAHYGQLFGLKDQANELRVIKEKKLPDGRTFVRFQQRYQGIPIVGGELIIQAGPQQKIISANGEILPDLKLDATPTITAAAARQTALTKVAKDYSLPINQLTAVEPELWIYNPVLLGGPGRQLSRLV
jgi:Zn-dependent metalloprotease